LKGVILVLQCDRKWCINNDGGGYCNWGPDGTGSSATCDGNLPGAHGAMTGSLTVNNVRGNGASTITPANLRAFYAPP
jgi:hypothetical protein